MNSNSYKQQMTIISSDSNEMLKLGNSEVGLNNCPALGATVAVWGDWTVKTHLEFTCIFLFHCNCGEMNLTLQLKHQ